MSFKIPADGQGKWTKAIVCESDSQALAIVMSLLPTGHDFAVTGDGKKIVCSVSAVDALRTIGIDIP